MHRSQHNTDSSSSSHGIYSYTITLVCISDYGATCLAQDRFKKAYFMFGYSMKQFLYFYIYFHINRLNREGEQQLRSCLYAGDCFENFQIAPSSVGQRGRQSPHTPTGILKDQGKYILKLEGVMNSESHQWPLHCESPYSNKWVSTLVSEVSQMRTFFSRHLCNHPHPFPIGSPSDPFYPEITQSKVRVVSLLPPFFVIGASFTHIFSPHSIYP